jgi:electron transfer flavoprotein beta subunit
LNIPYVSYVKKITGFENGVLSLHRLMDDGYDEVEMPLPGLLTVVKEINQPRVPSLKGKMRAKSLSIKTMNAEGIGADPESIGLPGSTTQVVKVFSPEFRGERAMLEGTVDEQVEQLVKKLEPYL